MAIPFQDAIIKTFQEHKLNPFQSIVEDKKEWQQSLENARATLAQKTHELVDRIKEIQKGTASALSLQTGMKSEVMNSLESKFQQKVKDVNNLEDAVGLVSQYKKEIGTVPLPPLLKTTLTSWLEWERQNVQQTTPSTTQQTVLRGAFVSAFQLALARTSAETSLQTAQQRSLDQLETEFQISHEIGMLENKIKRVTQLFDENVFLLQKQITEKELEFQRWLTEIKDTLKALPPEVRNPCDTESSSQPTIGKIPTPSETVSVPSMERVLLDKYPEKRDPRFAWNLQKEIIQKYPLMQMDRPLPPTA